MMAMATAKKLSTYFDRYPKKYLWLLAVAIGTLARIAVASLGHNDDFNFWLRHAEVVRNGGNLYEGVEFYGYGPVERLKLWRPYRSQLLLPKQFCAQIDLRN